MNWSLIMLAMWSAPTEVGEQYLPMEYTYNRTYETLQQCEEAKRLVHTLSSALLSNMSATELAGLRFICYQKEQ